VFLVVCFSLLPRFRLEFTFSFMFLSLVRKQQLFGTSLHNTNRSHKLLFYRRKHRSKTPSNWTDPSSRDETSRSPPNG
jgi:hypothetical protein